VDGAWRSRRAASAQMAAFRRDYVARLADPQLTAQQVKEMVDRPICDRSALERAVEATHADDGRTECCPLTCAPIVNRAIDKHGNVFERTYICAWIHRHGTHPLTREPMGILDIEAVPTPEATQLLL